MSMYVHSRIITEKVLPPRFAFDADLANILLKCLETSRKNNTSICVLM